MLLLLLLSNHSSLPICCAPLGVSTDVVFGGDWNVIMFVVLLFVVSSGVSTNTVAPGDLIMAAGDFTVKLLEDEGSWCVDDGCVVVWIVGRLRDARRLLMNSFVWSCRGCCIAGDEEDDEEGSARVGRWEGTDASDSVG